MEKHVVVCILIATLLNLLAAPVASHDPDYNYDYLEDDCRNMTAPPRIRNLADPDSNLYGYVKVVRDGGYHENMDCIMTVQAPPNYYLTVRIYRIEIYSPMTGCNYDYMQVIGASNALTYCGYGSVPGSIMSTSTWLKFRIHTSDYDDSDDIGFNLYYTAVHNAPCDSKGANKTEFECWNYDRCSPWETTCDGRDNCGDWSDESVNTCGLSTGAIVAISVVCGLIGVALIAFLIYFIYTKEKDKQQRRNRQNDVRPTTTAEYSSRSVRRPAVATVPTPPVYDGPLGDLPPAYTEMGSSTPYDTIPVDHMANGGFAGDDGMVTINVNGAVTTATNDHVNTPRNVAMPTDPSHVTLNAFPIGVPPPLYSEEKGGAHNPTYQND